MMKRNHSIFCALALAACCFLAGCANGETTAGTPPQEPTSAMDTKTIEASYQLPTVDSVDEKTMTSAVKQWVETVYGVDLTGWEAYYSLTDAAGAGQNDAGISFMGAEGEAPYLAEIDQESKEIISVETAAWKAATPSDIAKQADYVSAAKAFAEEYLKATGLQEAVCDQRGSDDQQRLCCFPGDADLCGSLRRRGPRSGGVPPLRECAGAERLLTAAGEGILRNINRSMNCAPCG